MDKKEEIIEINKFNWKLPSCCEADDADCEHVIKPKKPKKTNIAL